MKKPFFLLVVAVFLLSGCATARHAVPSDLLNDARIFGMQDVRAFSGSPSDSFKKDFVTLLEQEGKSFSIFDFRDDRTYSFLAVSGGGAYGAYGAGLLNGWSQSGARPVFKVVTGVSAGAITAPFAFLGSQYDGKLKEFFTVYSTKDLLRFRIPFGNSLATAKGLERHIEKFVDKHLLEEITAEYNKGRRLYVGTTNLDAQRFVIWDMGKIASIGNSQALKLFRKIILASASIPIAFPPVYLDAEINHKTYNEMHVDGGALKQVFFIYDVVEGIEKVLKEKGVNLGRIHYKIFIIRNGYADPVWQEVPDKLSAIAGRTIDTITNAQGIGDMYQLYRFTKSRSGDFNLSYIPATYVMNGKELFDSAEMRRLFNIGFDEAAKGYEWKKSLPGLD